LRLMLKTRRGDDDYGTGALAGVKIDMGW
jgi:twitching motility protein PilU